MPTLDRRPRQRRRRDVDTPDEDYKEVQRAMHSAGRDPEAWAALRVRVIRGLVGQGIRPERAAGIFEAFRRRPELLPMLPPESGGK